jgi:hypothetical protein
VELIVGNGVGRGRGGLLVGGRGVGGRGVGGRGVGGRGVGGRRVGFLVGLGEGTPR